MLLEKSLLLLGHKCIAGIDEVGRGPLAGPVVAACVVFPGGFDAEEAGLMLIKDSKKLTAKDRVKLDGVIRDRALGIGIGSCDNDTIDRLNILQATFLAMKMAIGDIKTKPDYILVDGGFPIPNLSIPQKAVVHGDGLIFSIAAASIVAKVYRDHLMEEWHERFPQFGFDRHKGYGTKFHMEKLSVHGPCPIHRRSFAPIKKLVSG